MSAGDAAIFLARLSTVFMVEGGLFLESRVSVPLRACVAELVRACSGAFDLASPVPGVGSFKVPSARK